MPKKQSQSTAPVQAVKSVPTQWGDSERRLALQLEGLENRLENKVRVEAERLGEKIDSAVDAMARTVHIGLETIEQKFKVAKYDLRFTDDKIDCAYADLKGYLKRLDSLLASVQNTKKEKSFESVGDLV